jgi:cell division protein FtsI/penicillin-binding protein 2
LTRAAPLGAVALLAFAAGLVYAGGPGRAERHLATEYVTDWEHSDFPQMYALLDPTSRAHMTETQFAAAYASAATMATATSFRPLRIAGTSGSSIAVRMRVATSVFGTLRETLRVPFTGSGSGARVHWTPTLAFPGLSAGEQLNRKTHLAPRASILADNGVALAEGPHRTSPIPVVANEIVGTLGRIPMATKPLYASEGFPPNAKVGQDGLELVFQQQLAGTPGGTLYAGQRALAHSKPVPGLTAHTTIDPTIEQATINAIGSSYAGMVAMDPKTGALLGLAGIAYSDIQPPGSTMKIVTASAALQARLVSLTTEFPVQTEADIDGYELQNSNGESCGGTLLNAFAVSCNSVFAPLGVTVGAQRLVSMAEKFGFNEPSTIPGALESVIPSAATIGSALSVGSSAIGQGMVEASPLEMTDIAATIADHGRRPIPSLVLGAKPKFVHVISRHTAADVQQMMIAVVSSIGTGYTAEIPGVTVAGKTGTAELTDTANSDSASDTDAWFVGYAPAQDPEIVAGALYPSAGFGAQTAAPAVRQVIIAALAHKLPPGA